MLYTQQRFSEIHFWSRGLQSVQPLRWNVQGTDRLITPDKFNFTSTKRTSVYLVQISFDKGVSRSHLAVQLSTNNNDFY